MIDKPTLFPDADQPLTIGTEVILALLDGTPEDVIIEALRRIGEDDHQMYQARGELGEFFERLREALSRFDFAVRVRAMNETGEAASQQIRNDATHISSSSRPRRPSAVLDRFIRDTTSLGKGSDREDVADEFESHGGIRKLLSTLPDYRQLPHIAEKVATEFPNAEKVPRQGTRGNAAIFVLDKFARTRALSLNDLVHAFRVMKVVESEDAVARRLVAWEINELRRRNWPVVRVPGEGFRFGSEDTNM